ncbi:outer membrane receptor for ferrienterochelin and colicins [Paenimyroides ummariense]|uniref:Outer membrane receptor for ferrienterochelin and colicins n=1 Tax=Paenimyroides ummariense TaxID=913024 RepID=A0A1I4XD13_9FLAO|nr:TonB-dependent receptor [Paenimyroides ummariense]SFN23139.1 outer membrane receptor for ferrienterochelin and colicins [Paenimyroides ummariense]
MKQNILLMLSLIGFQTAFSQVEQDSIPSSIEDDTLDEIVISGTMKPVLRSESLVPVEVYTPTFFKKNPTSNVFEALQIVNGVRPQVNCSVCNTGDIHINGLEGPYTFVLIDGMPIVSGLSTVYGLSGIPNSLIERVEVVKGPASSLYGSEAVGGLINIITKNPKNASLFSADVFGTSWGEVNTDVGLSTKVGEKAHLLMGVNYFNYSNPIDKNNDNFTDLTLQDRISVFQKWNFSRKSNKLFTIAGRYFYEDRWGGEMDWNKSYRGGDEVYGESIYTNRYELMGTYELPFAEKMFFSFSYADHDQNSVYGNTPYMAKQQVGFGQLTWDKKLGKHDMLFGAAFRYTSYDDNTPATNEKDVTTMPGFFAQDEISLNTKHSILLGARYDYNNNHGSIFTPRVAYRYKANTGDVLRLNAGTGFRVVNLFTEDHAALSGSRDVIVLEDLKPEKSYNVNLSYLKQWYFGSNVLQLEASTWYTYFTNAILPDYDTNPNQIIYDNLNGHATSKGISANVDLILGNGLKFIVGGTLMDVSTEEEGVKQRQMLTERFSGTWAVSYTIPSINLDIDYTGNLYGPMRLPLVSEWDPRPEYSETYSIQNIQLTYKGFKNFQIYGGVKNLLNWTPSKNVPFLISRSNDPFDKNVQFDPNGNAMRTPDNPYGLVFDPSYVYAANQGIRTFLGVRYNF